VFVTKFEKSTLQQPATIEMPTVDDQRATEVRAWIYEHRPISSSFGRGSESKKKYHIRLHQTPSLTMVRLNSRGEQYFKAPRGCCSL